MTRTQAGGAVLLLVSGIVLRIAPFAVNRSLWLDEAKLALNILERSPAQLFQPLDYDQAAPVGFLLLEKEAVNLLGEGERALRLVPLLAGLASLGLFYVVARRWLSPGETLLALALFALDTPLVYYASEVKQYSTDVFVALLLLFAAGRAIDHDAHPHARWLLVPAGVAGVWLSHPAIFVAAGAGVTLVLFASRRGERRRTVLFAAVAAAWLASFLVHYALVLNRSDPRGHLVRFWAEGFPPLLPRSARDLLWLPDTFFGFFVDPGGLPFAGLAAVAFVGGCWRWRSDARLLGLLVFPMGFTLLAALLRLYPFPTSGTVAGYPLTGRPILFLVPAAIILVAAGIGWVARSPDRDRRVLGGVMAGCLVAALVSETVRHPAHRIVLHEVRPLVEALAEQGHPGDIVVLNTRVLSVFRYYLRRLAERAQSVRALGVVELRGTNDWDAYEAQLQALPPGTRAWILYAHHPSWRSEQDEAFVLHILDQRGQLRRKAKTPGASLYLYRIGAAESTPDGDAAPPEEPPGLSQ
jgi:hypothetical protein